MFYFPHPLDAFEEIAALLIPSLRRHKVRETQWIEIELFRQDTRVGRAETVKVLGRDWLRFYELKRDGSFSPERDFAERKLFARRVLTEDEARRIVMGDPWSGGACTEYSEPSAMRGHCSACGHDREEHARALSRRDQRSWCECRYLDVAGVLGMGRQVSRLALKWSTYLDHGMMLHRDINGPIPAPGAVIVDVEVDHVRLDAERWAALVAAGLPIMPYPERASEEPTSDGSGDGPLSLRGSAVPIDPAGEPDSNPF